MTNVVNFCRNFALIVFVFFITDVRAQEARITEFGIYDEQKILLQETRTIPANQVVRFGFCFEAFVNFFDDDKYMLTQSLVHPEILDKSGWPNKGYNVPRKFKVKNGIASGCVGYNAREKKESPAGDWIFSVSDGSRELLEFSFELR